MHRGRQHGDYQFGALRGFTGRGADVPAQLLQLGQHRLVQVDQVQRMAGLDQVARHLRAHVAQTNKRNLHDVGLLSAG